jgi:hypothetical protein
VSDLFGNEGGDDWRDHWDGMPEYANRDLTKAVVVVKLYFSSHDDFQSFEARLRDHLYEGRKPFDGRQRKDAKTSWWPPLPKGTDYEWATDEP